MRRRVVIWAALFAGSVSCGSSPSLVLEETAVDIAAPIVIETPAGFRIIAMNVADPCRALQSGGADQISDDDDIVILEWDPVTTGGERITRARAYVYGAHLRVYEALEARVSLTEGASGIEASLLAEFTARYGTQGESSFDPPLSYSWQGTISRCAALAPAVVRTRRSPWQR